MLRRLLFAFGAIAALGGPALAADLPTTKGPPVYTPPPPIFTWTGVYIGAQVGYEFGRAWPIIAGAAAAPFSPNGFVGGGHVGYNYQMGQFVLGVEGDVNGASYNGGNGVAFSRTPLDGSVRGRLGYTWDRAMLYATGGVAFADFHDTDPFGDSVWTGRVGWTAGGGLEYAIDNNWSLRAEYRYTDYGRYAWTGPVTGTAVSVRQIDNRVQAGFSYKFDMMGPVVSKY